MRSRPSAEGKFAGEENAPAGAHGPVGPSSPGFPRRNHDEDEPSAWPGSPRWPLEGHGAVRALGDTALHHRTALRWPDRTVGDTARSSTSMSRSSSPRTLQPGDVVILDNLASHKTKAEAILKRRGAWFHFLSPHSPDLSRDGLRQPQGPSQTHQRKNHRCPLESRWRHLLPLLSAGMLELPQRRWISPN